VVSGGGDAGGGGGGGSAAAAAAVVVDVAVPEVKHKTDQPHVSELTGV
jgi:hypothetical protein